MDWKIEVYTYTLTGGLSLSATYDNTSPGGIVSSLQVDIEGSGNCLSASFQGIPKKLTISDRNFAKIYINNLTTPKFYGYFSSVPNGDSTKVDTYQLQGVKTLLQSAILDVFWYSATADLSGSSSHYDIVNALSSYFPNYVLATDNQASTTSGNKPPVVATGKSVASIMDSIVAGATDAVYQWGVDGTGTLFVHTVSSTVLDLTTASNARVEYSTQNSEDIVTSVRFLFGVPPSYDGLLQMDGGSGLYQNVIYTGGSVSNNYYSETTDNKALMHSYTDMTNADKYGVFEKVINLPLSTSFTKDYTYSQAKALSQSRNPTGIGPTITVTPSVAGDWNTSSSSTALAYLSDGLSSTSMHPVSGAAAFYSTLQIDIAMSNGQPLYLDDIFAVKFTYQSQETTLAFGGEVDLIYTSGSNSDGHVPYEDRVRGYDTSQKTTHDTTDLYLWLPRRAYQRFPSDPTKTLIDKDNSSHTFNQDMFTLFSATLGLHWDWAALYTSGSSTTTLSTSSLQIYEARLVGLDTDLLDSYAKSFIKVPSEYPASLTTDVDYGLSDKASLHNASGTTVTEAVKRITYKLSRKGGTEVVYTLGNDPERNNALLDRIAARDNNASNTAFSNVQGNS